MPAKLFIVISEDLRGLEYLRLPEGIIEVLAIPQGRLTVEKEPLHSTDPWERELKKVVLERIQTHDKWKESTVRIAGHLVPCFGSLARTGSRDQRFEKIEASLVDALGHPVNVQIWGFHHDDGSEIWSVASRVKGFLGDPVKEAEFLSQLDEAFLKAATSMHNSASAKEQEHISDRFSLARHEIFRMFGPLQMTLENAREMRDEDPGRARATEARVDALIDDALDAAIASWKKCASIVPSGELKQSFEDVLTQLQKRPKPNSLDFRAWFDRLYDQLKKF
jgi:hypothetical protein